MSHLIRSLYIFGVCIFTASSLASQTIEGHVINAATGEGVPGAEVRQ